MKNLKKLSAAFFTAVLLSSGLTSCIDNEVSPLVESIYANQAELLAAQTAVQNANATLLQAQAAVQEANAAHQAAITAAFTASSAQDLLEQIAETELAVEEARIAMLLAQAEFDQDLEQILAAIRTAQNLEAGQHAADYAVAMSDIADLKDDKLEVLGEISAAQLYMKSTEEDSEMTWEVYLANLETAVLAKEASVIANEAFIVRANEYLAGDYADMVAALAVAEAAVEAKEAEIEALEAEETQINADIEEEGNYEDFIDAFDSLEEDLAGLKEDLDEQEGIAEELEDETIPGLVTTIADYAGKTTTLTDAETTAMTAETTAQGAVEAAEAALGEEEEDAAVAGDDAIEDATTLYEILWNAQLAVEDAALAASDLQDAVDDLNGSYQDAIADYADAQSDYNLGAAGLQVALDGANGALTTGQNLVTSRQTDYDNKKDVFEANPTGFVWTAGTDGVLGIQTDNAGTNEDSYIAVTVVAGADNDTYSAISTVLPAGNNIAALNAANTYAMFAADGAGLLDGLGAAYTLTTNDYWNVGADDVFGGTHADRLDDALVDLTSALDAIEGLEEDVADAQEAIDNADGILAAAKLLFEEKRDLYEGQVALLEAANDVLEAANDAVSNDAETGAQDLVDAAEAALGEEEADAAVAGDDAIEDAETLYELLWNAQLAALDATAAKEAHLDTTVEEYEADLAEEQANLVAANNMISEITILITRAEADIAALQAEYDALIATPLYAAQQVRLLEIADELAVLDAEKEVLEAEEDALAISVSFEGLGDVEAIEDAIEDAQEIIDGAPAYLAMKAAQIALGEVSVADITAEIEKLTTDLADIDAQIAVLEVEAAGYLALLNAALGN